MSNEYYRVCTLHLPTDPDIMATMTLFREVRNDASSLIHKTGRHLSPYQAVSAYYHTLKGRFGSQLTQIAIRDAAYSYNHARNTGDWPDAPIRWDTPHVVYTVYRVDHSASFPLDGTVSLSTIAGRKRFPYTVVDGHLPTRDEPLAIRRLDLALGLGVIEAKVRVYASAAPPGQQWCIYCHECKPAAAFAPRANRPGQYQSTCRDCQRIPRPARPNPSTSFAPSSRRTSGRRAMPDASRRVFRRSRTGTCTSAMPSRSA